MNLFLNGEATSVPDAATVTSLLEQLGMPLEGRGCGSAIGKIVPKSLYATAHLAEGDRIDVVAVCQEAADARRRRSQAATNSSSPARPTPRASSSARASTPATRRMPPPLKPPAPRS